MIKNGFVKDVIGTWHSLLFLDRFRIVVDDGDLYKIVAYFTGITNPLDISGGYKSQVEAQIELDFMILSSHK